MCQLEQPTSLEEGVSQSLHFINWIHFSEILTRDPMDVINALSYSVIVERRQAHVGIVRHMQDVTTMTRYRGEITLEMGYRQWVDVFGEIC